MTDGFVVDNSVLSACYQRNWMELLGHKAKEVELLVPKRIWRDEFLPEDEAAGKPAYIETPAASQYPYFPDAPTAIGKYDLACLGLAAEYNYGVVTNDRPMFVRAKKRDLDPRWGTEFLIQAFLDCGISQKRFEEGKHDYVDDVYLPEKARRQMLNVQKSDGSENSTHQ